MLVAGAVIGQKAERPSATPDQVGGDRVGHGGHHDIVDGAGARQGFGFGRRIVRV